MSGFASTAEHIALSTCGAEVPYRVRRSQRARRIRLAVNARDGLVVTLPARAAERHAHDAVCARVQWALGALETVAERRALVLGGPVAWLPETVELRACGRTIPVSYRQVGRPASPAVAREREGVLVISGPSADSAEERLAAVKRWHDRTARTVLPQLLEEYAGELGVRPTRVSVRGQRTRWGSCSSRGTVSLNRDLLFLPPRLVRYVLVHELCHLAHLDHSPRFWKRMEDSCPDARALRRELSSARDSYVPVWADG